MKTVLDIGSGKDIEKWIDEEYCEDVIPGYNAGEKIEIWCVDKSFSKSGLFYGLNNKYIARSNKNIDDFLSTTLLKSKVSYIHASRFFEHYKYDKLHYLFYKLFEVADYDCIMDIVVPDFDNIAKVVKNMDANRDSAMDFNRDLIVAHTEIFNELYDPHQSLWNTNLAYYYIELEEYWRIMDIEHNYCIDNRNCYMHISCTVEK